MTNNTSRTAQSDQCIAPHVLKQDNATLIGVLRKNHLLQPTKPIN